MLWDASAINGYTIKASDGRLGVISDLLFDDADWTIRWLVVDTGYWLPGRKVLLPLSALVRPDRAQRQFSVKLTMQQVKDSPDVDADRPVSRQTEARIHEYFGWDPYWVGGLLPMDNAIATPFVAPLYESGVNLLDPVRADVRPHKNDPHLRSAAVVTGYHAHATDGEIGHVEDFLVDDADWTIRFIKIDTRNWWPGERVLIGPYSIRKIDWGGRLVYLDVSRQKVKDSPPYDPSVTVDGAYEEKFLTYYGIRWVAI